MSNRHPLIAALALCSVCALAYTPDANALEPDVFFDVYYEALSDRRPAPRVIKQLDKATPLLFQGPGGGFDVDSMTIQESPASPPATLTRLPSGDFQVDSFFDITYRIAPPGGDFVVDSFFDIAYTIEFNVDPDPDLTNDDQARFNMNILEMDFGSATPGGDNSSGTQLRLAPGGGHGHVTVLKIAGPPGGGGDFQVDSFFDISLELSADGGNTWIPASQNTELFESVSGVPEPGSLALLGATGVIALRRRR